MSNSINLRGKYRTLNGYDVRLICVDGPGPQPVVGFIGESAEPAKWGKDGTYLIPPNHGPSGLDLFEVSPPRLSPVEVAARNVCDHMWGPLQATSDWDQLKNAIGELADAIGYTSENRNGN